MRRCASTAPVERPATARLLGRVILAGALFSGLLFSGLLCPAAVQAELRIFASQLTDRLSRPVFLTTAPGDTDNLYVIEQHQGRIRRMDRAAGTVAASPFLDISNIRTGNEQGLLGLAFHPNYADNGHFFVNYTDSVGTTQIVRYTVSSTTGVADPASATRVLSYTQPQSNHNGGWMGFGPNDGYLYISSGDGGGSNDNGTGHTSGIGNSQDITNNLLGKMLRIDIDGDDFPADANRNYAIPPSNPFVSETGDDEIWSYGLRNPWRASFDRANGDLYIADVGQGAREEVNYQPADSPGGENYGWRLREGTIATPNAVGGPAPPGAVDPIHEYSHVFSSEGGFSITGGYVYRGPIASLQGHYFFADYVTEQIWSLRYDGQSVSDFGNRTPSIVTDNGAITSIVSFGEDHDGNLYVVSLEGDIYRFDNAVDGDYLVSSGAVWRYLDDGSNQGQAWREPQFDDSGWDAGPAQLGYGDGDEQTVVDFGGSSSNKHVTTYFRHAFNLDTTADVAGLVVDLLRDDGAAVYLNGTEVVRTENLAPDAAFDTLANYNGSGAVGGADESRFFTFTVDPNVLLPGENVLAVEIHQESRDSSDISFDLALFADRLPSVGDFDRSGVLDTADLEFLVGEVRQGVADNVLDVNEDGNVSLDDAMYWVTDLAGTVPGDINLDGRVDAVDFAGLEDHLFQDMTLWSSGDFNFDGLTDGLDFHLWLSNRGFVAPRADGVAVPEPATVAWGLLLLSVCFSLGRSRQRGEH